VPIVSCEFLLDFYLVDHQSARMKSRKRQHGKIDVVARGRWVAYAAAAAATNLAAAHTAEAEIHYSGPINQNLAGRHDVTIPLDPAGGSFLAGHNNYVAGSSSFSAGGVAFLYFHGLQSAAVAGATCSEDTVCASNLQRGDVISVRPFAQRLGVLAYDFYFNFWNSFGNFRYHGLGLVGFKFNNGAGDQYGWVRVKMFGPRRNKFTVVDFAYGDPGERVSAGQKSSSESAPSLESVGGLALGAAGLLAWRRRRRQVRP
jgi:MYXO-CTERM domain-containing protein